jgi:hypothetical protein
MANTKISQLNPVTTLTANDTFPVVQGSETKKAKISDVKNYLPISNSVATGLLTNTDWNTFNNKQNTLTLGNLTESTSSVLTISGNVGSVIGSGLTIQVKQASSSQGGYLSSSDWTTFNNKMSSLSLTTTGTSGSATLVGSTLNIPQYLGSAVTSLGSQTGATQTFSTDTTGTDFTITSAANNHKFSIPNASASARGLLTAADYSTFNGKQNALTLGNLTESTSSVLTITGGTGSVVGSGTTIQVKQANGSQGGFLSSGDWTTFNGKQGTLTLTTTGSSGAATLVNNVLNVPQYNGGGTDSINWPHTEALPSIGSAIKAEPVYSTMANLTSNAFNPVSQRIYLIAMWVPRAMTITGVKWIQATVGSFVASNFNGVALYTQSGGTFTRQAFSANDATIFTTAGSSVIRNKAFTSTYSASAGVHYAALMYSALSGTAPALMISPSPVYNGYTLDNTNGMYLSMFAASQTSFPSTLSISGNLLSVNIPYLSLY